MLIEKKKRHYLTNDVELVEVFIPDDFNQEHEMINDLVEKFVIKDVAPVLDKIENQKFDETVRLMNEAGQLGLISADIPEAVRGLGLGKICSTIISKKMALARSFSITFGGQTGIGGQITAYALTEPGAGTDAMSVKTTAIPSDCNGYYILNGEKQWISNAGFAGIFIVFAKIAVYGLYRRKGFRWSVHRAGGKEDGSKRIFNLFCHFRQCKGPSGKYHRRDW
ncbi:MAG TPA: acyl-CoA dehydrogenase family protein [Metabacillus sp.]|nr:acyl-CoA dehydrogenase family protein [Metabacillus sp.]